MTRHSVAAVAIAASVSGAWVATGSGAPQEPVDFSASATRKAAAAYVSSYQRDLTFVLADETYTQTRLDARAAGRGRAASPETRTLTGELFLAYLPDDHRWMAVHDVAEVDGVSVEGRDTLRDLLAVSPIRAVGAAVAARNARYNLGRISRNFNEPTLALQFFDPSRLDRVRFTRRRVNQRPDGTIVTLGFEERQRPTLIGSIRGGPLYAEGDVDVVMPGGAIARTELRIRDGAIAARLETFFERHEPLGLWVPIRFTERYADGTETVTCEAEYRNFRRFQTSGRLVGDPGAN